MASGWIAAALLGLLDLPAKINSFHKEAPAATEHVGNWLFLDEALTGKWVSVRPPRDILEPPADPQLDALGMLEGTPVHLEMTVYRGSADGAIASGGLRSNHVYSLVHLEGRARGDGIEGIAWDGVGGKRVELAHFTLAPAEHDGEEVLVFKIVRQGNAYFPAEAILWRTDEEPEGEPNPEFVQMLDEIVKGLASSAAKEASASPQTGS